MTLPPQSRELFVISRAAVPAEAATAHLPQKFTLPLLQRLLVSEDERLHLRLHHLGFDLHLLGHGLDLLHAHLGRHNTTTADLKKPSLAHLPTTALSKKPATRGFPYGLYMSSLRVSR